jgi:hypothetical protein
MRTVRVQPSLQLACVRTMIPTTTPKDHYRRTIGTRQLKTYLETLEDLEFLEVDVDPDDKRKHIYTVYREEV